MDLSLFFVVFAMGGGAIVVFFFFPFICRDKNKVPSKLKLWLLSGIH